jgi:hypothetical protein
MAVLDLQGEVAGFFVQSANAIVFANVTHHLYSCICLVKEHHFNVLIGDLFEAPSDYVQGLLRAVAVASQLLAEGQIEVHRKGRLTG